MAAIDGRSIFGAPATSDGGSRIELGFVRSHADIGGGYGTGDLSDVALMWMIEQGAKQGIVFLDKTVKDNGWDTVSIPIIHDKSGNMIDPAPMPTRGDREFVYGDGRELKQGTAVIGGYDTAWAKSIVSYYEAWCGPGSAPAVGLVDMEKYSASLKRQGVSITCTKPSSPHPCF